MNATADERLVVMLEARISEFEKRMRKAEGTGTRTYTRLRRDSRTATQAMEQDMIRSTSRINQALATTSTRIGAFGKAFIGGAVVGAASMAFAGLNRNVMATVKSIAGLGDVSRRVSIGTGDLQGLQHGFQMAGIAADELNASLARFGRRVGEAAEGGGPLQSTQERWGLSVRHANGQLKSQMEMLREIAEIIRKAPSDQQKLAIAQAAFGDSGRRMVNAFKGGAEGIDGMIEAAHKAGVILDSELVRKAEEIDAKFNEMTARVSAWGKKLAVTLAITVADLADLRERLDRIFPDEAQGRAILGDDLYDALTRDRDAMSEQAAAVERLAQAHAVLARDARAAAHEIGVAVQELPTEGFEDQRAALEETVAEMRRLADGIDTGTVSAVEFQDGMGKATREAEAMFRAIQNDRGIYFVNVMSALDGLMGRLAGAIGLAQGLHGALQQAAGVDPTSKAMQALRQRHGAEATSIANAKALAEANAKFTASEQARNAATSDALKLEREVEAVRKRARDAGVTLTDAQARTAATAALAGEAARQAADKANRGKGGGKDKLDDFARTVEQIRDQTRALEAEAAALIAVAESGKDYGDALEYARKRAELLNAAQKAGKAITPQLKAEIDALAGAYVTAGLNAEEAAERLKRIEENGKRGAEAISDIFTSVLDGSRSARQAVADLLMEMAKVQMRQAILGFGNSGGFLGSIFGAIGGALGGARAKGGPVQAGVPYLVNENTPRSEVFVPSTSGAVLNVQQAQAALSGAGGGGGKVEVVVRVDQNGNWQAAVERISSAVVDERAPAIAAHVVHRATPAIVQQSVKTTGRVMQSTKTFGNRFG